MIVSTRTVLAGLAGSSEPCSMSGAQQSILAKYRSPFIHLDRREVMFSCGVASVAGHTSPAEFGLALLRLSG